MKEERENYAKQKKDEKKNATDRKMRQRKRKKKGKDKSAWRRQEEEGEGRKVTRDEREK